MMRRHTTLVESVANNGSKAAVEAHSIASSNIPKTPRLWKEAVAGGCAGAMAKTLVAPIERVKLWMQLGSTDQSAWQVTRMMYREQGIWSFWRGNGPNIIRQAGTVGLNFMFMDYYKTLSNKFTESRGSKMGAAFLSGGLAGGTCTTLLYPMEFLRTRLAMESSGRTGMLSVLLSTLKTDGIKGMYQGYGIALAGVFLYRGLHLGGYDALKMQLVHYKQSSDLPLSWGERFAVAQTVSLVAGTISYPIDSVRRRMMMQAGKPQKLYRSSIHAVRVIAQQEGMRGFYLGIGPNLVRSVGAAVLLVVYDGVKVML
jgi:solute carrier family 25 (mitochondrial adenine nucleotide translocator), member 4/5/6/31